MEEKLIKVLEYFLSLHEADEVYEALFDENIDQEQIIKMLDYYRSLSGDVVVVEELDDLFHLYNSGGQLIEGDFETYDDAVGYANDNDFVVLN